MIRWADRARGSWGRGDRAVISFSHIEHLALVNGQALLAARLLPGSVDGAVLAAAWSCWTRHAGALRTRSRPDNAGRWSARHIGRQRGLRGHSRRGRHPGRGMACVAFIGSAETSWRWSGDSRGAYLRPLRQPYLSRHWTQCPEAVLRPPRFPAGVRRGHCPRGAPARLGHTPARLGYLHRRSCSRPSWPPGRCQASGRLSELAGWASHVQRRFAPNWAPACRCPARPSKRRPEEGS